MSEGPRIDQNLLCVSCGYNLRTLPMAGHCPECNTPVKKTFESTLVNCEKTAVQDARRAARILVWLRIFPVFALATRPYTSALSNALLFLFVVVLLPLAIGGTLGVLGACWDIVQTRPRLLSIAMKTTFGFGFVILLAGLGNAPIVAFVLFICAIFLVIDAAIAKNIGLVAGRGNITSVRRYARFVERATYTCLALAALAALAAASDPAVRLAGFPQSGLTPTYVSGLGFAGKTMLLICTGSVVPVWILTTVLLFRFHRMLGPFCREMNS